MTRENVPQLRFKGFEGEWNNTKLGEAFTIFNGYAFASSSSVDEGVLWVKIADVGIQKMKSNNLSYLPISLKEKHKKFILKKGDFVVALTRPILNGKLKIAQINRFFDGALLNQRVGKIISNNSHYFIYSLLQKDELIKSIENNIAGSDPPNLSPNEINSIEISYPPLPEQQKIASFLSAVDEKIQQLSRKKELLEQYKKGVMQQLFSGKLRFKDENGNNYPDWEEKKLGEVCEIIGGGTPDTNISEYWGGEIQWFTPTEIKSDFVYKSIRTITELGLQKSSAKKLPIGTILLTTRATIGEVSISQKECSTNQGFQSLIVKEGNNNIFIFNWIKRNKHELIARANGSTFPEISKSAIKKISLNVPCLTEQQKIANFLSGIDGKIEQVNGELVKTQEFKKGLLQQLFV